MNADRPAGLSELVLIVSDVPRATAFYRDVVGLTLEHPPSEAWAWFWSGAAGASPRLALHCGPLLFEEHSPFPPGQRFGRVHFALRLERAGVEAALDRLRAAGVEVHGPTRLEWMGADSRYFFDPDGHLVEFWSPDPAPDSTI